MALRVPLHMPRSAVPAALRVRLCTAGVRGSGVRFISSSKAEEKKRLKEADVRDRPFAERGFQNARDRPRERRYWPPKEESIELPGGRKQVQVVASKRDVDGYLEAQLVFMTPDGHRLFYLNEEELDELVKLAPRLTEYMELWQEKAQEASDAEADAATRRTLRALAERSSASE
ncbi:unnamed protein product [Durusdinium trenchii]|uniref:Uncharacterized protein n=2 Tax=Durusdinium trenchii TaxID=1381693 RepID=A0ABP0QRS2_9DINO